MSEPRASYDCGLPNTITLVLPWPDKRLSPNARGAWYVKENPRKTAREIGSIAVVEAQQAGRVFLPERLQMWVTFHPPRRGRYDLDNALSKLKPALDGAFAALGRDDAEVCVIVLERGEVLKGGRVMVIIGEVQA
jgi:crossover junction endodeoxyribonuclease RusA